MGGAQRSRGHVMAYLLLLVGAVTADVYLHVPRGSNNRLDETTATRRNANRLFDSQNNNRGGYNVGDKTDKPAGDNEDKQYSMKYFMSGPPGQNGDSGRSFLNIEWTNQHGCGRSADEANPQKQNCALVLQFMCQDSPRDSNLEASDVLRNGVSTRSQTYRKPGRGNVNSVSERKARDVDQNTGLHESWDWYNRCYLRDRNMGLFVADQELDRIRRLRFSSAIHTRQNADGDRYGYECPEERDYFPYWHPTPWMDVAVLAESDASCTRYQTNSFNVQPYHECIEDKGWSRHNTEADCTGDGGRWLLLHSYLEKAEDLTTESQCVNAQNRGDTRTPGQSYKWAIAHDSSNGYSPECLVTLDAPDCMEAPWSRSNHNGNGLEGEPNSYKWTLPYFPSGKDKKCVFRIRYNISTDDYDPFNTDYRHNEETSGNSPVVTNPYVQVMSQVTPLRLAINTAQFGRTFQDRSHVFELRPRPSNDIAQNDVIHNLNVRGKRGNIVQAYPAVEYDFAPNELRIKQGELVHIQWTGSNTHRNNGNGGDGQAGAAGEGDEGTDRHNLLEMADRAGNFPIPFESSTMWDGVEVLWIYHGNTGLSTKDLAINMASSGYFQCAERRNCQSEAVDAKSRMSSKLNNAPASYEGAVLRFTKRGTYHFMCTRNNNFTNRSQKAAIIVE